MLSFPDPFLLQYECEDALGDSLLFDALGVGLGRTEMVNVALAVKKLGEDPQKAVDTVSTPAQVGLLLEPCNFFWGQQQLLQ